MKHEVTNKFYAFNEQRYDNIAYDYDNVTKKQMVFKYHVVQDSILGDNEELPENFCEVTFDWLKENLEKVYSFNYLVAIDLLKLSEEQVLWLQEEAHLSTRDKTNNILLGNYRRCKHICV